MGSRNRRLMCYKSPMGSRNGKSAVRPLWAATILARRPTSGAIGPQLKIVVLPPPDGPEVRGRFFIGAGATAGCFHRRRKIGVGNRTLISRRAARSMESPVGIDPTTSSSLSSRACDNTDYVPSIQLFALTANRVTARRDIVRYGT
jgi:hypothetical protein